MAQLIKQFALYLIFLEGGSLGRVVGVVASAEAALPWRLKMLAASAHVVSRCGRAGEWVLVLVLAVVPSCLLKCVNVSKAGETARWVVLRRRLRILHKLATRADKGWPRCCQDLRLWHIQHCLHHGFFALAPVAHDRMPSCIVLLPIPRAGPALRLLAPIPQLLAPLYNLI